MYHMHIYVANFAVTLLQYGMYLCTFNAAYKNSTGYYYYLPLLCNFTCGDSAQGITD